jgi:hypothetical protein
MIHPEIYTYRLVQPSNMPNKNSVPSSTFPLSKASMICHFPNDTTSHKQQQEGSHCGIYFTSNDTTMKKNIRGSWLHPIHRRIIAIIVSYLLNYSIVLAVGTSVASGAIVSNDVQTMSARNIQNEGDIHRHHRPNVKMNGLHDNHNDFNISKGLFVTNKGTMTLRTKKSMNEHDAQFYVDAVTLDEHSFVQKQRRRVQKDDGKTTSKATKAPARDSKNTPQGEDNRGPPQGKDTPSTPNVPSFSPNYSLEPTVLDEDAKLPTPTPSEFDEMNSTNTSGLVTMQLSEFEIQATVTNDDISDEGRKTTNDLLMAFQEYLQEELNFSWLRSINLELIEDRSTNSIQSVKEKQPSNSQNSKTDNIVDDGYHGKDGRGGSDVRHRDVKARIKGLDTSNRRLSQSNQTNTKSNDKNITTNNKSYQTQNSSTGPSTYYRLMFSGTATFAGSVYPQETVLKEEQSYLLVSYTEQLDVYMAAYVSDRIVQVERITIINADDRNSANATWTRDVNSTESNNGTLLEQMSSQTIIIVVVSVAALFFVVTALFVVRYKHHRIQLQRRKEATKNKKKKKSRNMEAAAAASSSETSAVDADIANVNTGSTESNDDDNNNNNDTIIMSPRVVNGGRVHESVEVSGSDSDEDDDNDNNNKNYSAMYSSPTSNRGLNTQLDDSASCGSMSDIISVTDWGDHSIGSTVTAPIGSKHNRRDKLSATDKILIKGGPNILEISTTPTSSTHERMMFN